MEIEREAVQTNPETGDIERIHTQQHTVSAAAAQSAIVDRTSSYIWYVVGLINALLLLRLFFLLLGANATGFAALIYQVTAPLVALFRGIFPATSSGTSYFDVATVLAVIVYTLIGWGIVSLIDISKRNRTA